MSTEVCKQTKEAQSHPIADIKAGVVLLDKDGYALLIHQKHNSIWSLPRGSVKVGESIYDGACRKMLEESSIDVKGLPVKQTIHFKMNRTVMNNQVAKPYKVTEITHYVIQLTKSRDELYISSPQIYGHWWVNPTLFQSMKSKMGESILNAPTVMTLRSLALNQKEQSKSNCVRWRM